MVFRKHHKSRHIFALLALLALGLSSCSGISRNMPPRGLRADSGGLGDAKGFWQDEAQTDYLVALKDRRVFFSLGGQVRRVATVLDRAGSWLRLCEDGQESTIEVSLDNQKLTIRNPQTTSTHHLRRLPAKPQELALSPLRLPAPSPVTADRAHQIEVELGKRALTDQEAQRRQFDKAWDTEANHSSATSQGLSNEIEDLHLITVRTENNIFLKKLVNEVGWIDSQRFGSTAADDAFLLTQHSQDLPLMLAALPHVKAEVETKGLQGEAYALLYDRIQLLLGKKQRYGTRVGKDSAGRLIVLPTEEPEKVDNRRKGLGMPPLSEYVRIFGATAVSFSSACASARDPG